MLTEFTNEPNESDLAVILNDLIRLNFADKRHEILHKRGILSQNIFEHLDGLSGHICDLKTEEVLELGGDGLRQVW